MITVISHSSDKITVERYEIEAKDTRYSIVEHVNESNHAVHRTINYTNHSHEPVSDDDIEMIETYLNSITDTVR